MPMQAPYHTWLLFNECSRMVQWQQVLDCLFCLFETLFHCLVHVLHNGHVRFFRCQDGPYFPTKSSFFESPFFGSMHFTSQDDTLLDCVFYCVLDEAGSNLAFHFKGDVVLQRPQSGIYTNDVSLLIDGVTTVVDLSSQQGEGLQSRHRPLCLHDYPINFVVTFLPWDKVQRVGEASNPGPEHTIEEVNFSLVNPTGLYNKDDLVAALGPGTYSVAETHATTKAQCALKKKFRDRKLNVVFGKAVPSHLGKDNFKGIASGVACVSSFPTRFVPLNNSQILFDTCRILATHVCISPNIVVLVLTIYAPPRACVTIRDPKGLTIQLLDCAFQMASNWMGPSVIMGDFNHDIFDFENVNCMVQQGWADGQTLHCKKFGSNPLPTCVLPQGTSCNSNILISPQLIRSFSWCKTVDASFCGHPVLTLACRMHVLKRNLVVWRLPKPFDCHHFEQEAMENFHNQSIQCIREIDASIDNNEVDQAAKHWTQLTEMTLAEGARDSDNRKILFRKSHFNRNKGPAFKTMPLTQPASRVGRNSDVNALTVQGPTWHRQHLRQLRRLQTMVCLSAAMDRNPTDGCNSACDELWNKISNAAGFNHFPSWVVMKLHLSFPTYRPPTEEIRVLHEHFALYFHDIDRQIASVEKQRKQDIFSNDWDEGGRKTFAAIREEPIDPACFVAKTVKTKVIRVRWPKQGLTTIRVDTTQGFCIGLPVSFQGQTSNVVQISQDALIVETPLCLRDQNFHIKQKQYLYDPIEAGKEVVGAWNGFLKRDGPTDTWNDAETIFQGLPSYEPFTLPPFEPELWRRIQAKTPKRSARGACGFSVKELQSIPIWLLLVLFKIFDCIERCGTWPQQWVFAFTVLLPKTESPEHAMDLRPITVLSRVYRQWSRYRAIAIIKELSKNIPKTVAGGTANMSSLLLSGYFQDLFEDDDNLSTLCGLTVDIVKCYNTIPRFPLAIFMMKLGWPLSIVKAYMGALHQMKRTFLVLNCASEWQTASTGVPEGCALAVASMLTISIVLYHYVTHDSPTTGVFTFADNWSFVMQNFQHAQEISQKVEQFCKALRLRLSVPKSWTWALTTNVAKQMQTLSLQGEHIPSHCHVKDLGLDITYRGQKAKKTLHHRISLGLKRCRKVAQLGCPKRRKFRLVQGSCIPKAIYGTSLLHPSRTKFTSLRTNISKALGHAQTGSSPWIANNLLDKKADAEYHVILNTLRFWRQYFRTFPERKYAVLGKIQQSSPKGPSVALKTTLCKLGEINEEGLLLTETVGKVDWTSCSKRYLQFVVDLQWDQYVCQKLAHRVNFECKQTDNTAIKKCGKLLQSCEYFGLCTHLTGAHYTNDIKQKFLEVDTLCPHCKSVPDSRVHRTLYCEALAYLRTEWDDHTWTIARETTTSHYGLLGFPDELSTLRLSIPIVPVLPEPTRVICDFTEIIVFIDGSCFCATNPHTAIAGSAACIVTPYPKREVIHEVRTMLPTRDHNSHRAEIFALILALTLGKHLKIYGDCLSITDTFSDMLLNLRQDIIPEVRDNHDLWQHVINLAKPCCQTITIVKTKAHADDSGSGIRHWEAWANNSVDLAAKHAITIDHPRLLARFQVAENVLNQRREAHLKILDFQVKAAHAAFRKSHTHVTTYHNDPHGIIPTDVQTFPIPVIPDHIVHDCPINGDFVIKLMFWLANLKWETTQNSSTSYLELCLEFIYTTKSYPPVPVLKFPNRKNQSGRKWVLLLDSPQLDVNSFTMGQMIQGFSRTVNWLRGKHKIHLLPTPTKNQVTSLKKYGFRGKPAGVPIRAYLDHQKTIDQWCLYHLQGKQSMDIRIPQLCDIGDLADEIAN